MLQMDGIWASRMTLCPVAGSAVTSAVSTIANWSLGQGGKTARPIWVSYMTRIYNDPTLDYKKGQFKTTCKWDGHLTGLRSL